MKLTVNPKISEWLLKQPWGGKFIDNAIAEGRSPSDILEFVLGNRGMLTISGAFLWSGTPEGGKFWSDLHNELEGEYRFKGWKKFEKTINV